jgi:hypothetical protein
MRQRSRLYSIALARTLPTAYARTANPQRHTVTLACAHSRTHASTHTSVCSGSRRSLRPKLQAPLRCAASTTAPSHSATRNRRQATDNMQDGTGNGQETTCDRERASCNVQRDEMRRGAGDRQRTRHATWDTGAGNRNQTPCNGERATCNKERARRHDPTGSVPQTTTGKCATDNMQHATCIGENATDDMQYATGKMHLTTRSVHQTTSDGASTQSTSTDAIGSRRKRNGDVADGEEDRWGRRPRRME